MPRYTDRDLIVIRNRLGENLPVPPTRKTRDNSESRSQILLIKWWAVECRNRKIPEFLLMSFPLQGARTPINGGRMKAEGCRKGSLDLLLAVSSNGASGLFIEMKTATGRVSPEQKAMIDALRHEGYSVEICRSTGEAIKAIEHYLVFRA